MWLRFSYAQWANLVHVLKEATSMNYNVLYVPLNLSLSRYPYGILAVLSCLFNCLFPWFTLVAPFFFKTAGFKSVSRTSLEQSPCKTQKVFQYVSICVNVFQCVSIAVAAFHLSHYMFLTILPYTRAFATVKYKQSCLYRTTGI